MYTERAKDVNNFNDGNPFAWFMYSSIQNEKKKPWNFKYLEKIITLIYPSRINTICASKYN